ncbi:MAG: divalent-cation tolerance protein CutA [Planctomycetes bacterium]|nr:divalent-cation tolerance protein CutA [Planctomycetota bacterium]MCB9869652.1 divalent-cation tolerance protein CutA [Planctomycetota bacterium]
MVDRLLEERLVACVNFLGPVRSRYRWQGALEEAHEMLLLLKTSPAARERLRQRIVELHPYEVPEVLELGVDSGLPAYLAWVTECCDG